MRSLTLRVIVCVAIAIWLRLPAAARATNAQGPAPKRIISLVPAATEMLFAMGAGNAVVGVSSYDKFPPEVASRPKVGALLDPNFERILSLKSDLVIVYGTQADLIARLTRAGVPMFDYQPSGLPDITATVRALGARVGHVEAATKVAGDIERDVEGIRKQVAGRPRPKTVLVFEREPGSLRGLYVGAGIGFMHDMLEAAGGTDAFDDVKRLSLQATAELMLARAPEVIIEVHASSKPADLLKRETAVWNSLPALPAVRTGRVYLLADDRLTIPGPRVADGIRIMARALHPDVFK
jgi:iron complex transport system substrate-binding protein